MQLMQRVFQLLAACGCWPPPSSAPPYRKFFYLTYSMIIFTMLNIITILQFLDLILVVENQDEFSDNMYVTLTMIISCHKMYNLLKSHKNIAVLIDILEKEPFQPENEEEMEIRKKFDKQAHWQVIIFAAITQLSVVFYTTIGVLKTEGQTLPLRMWLPFDYLPLYLHVIVYFLQILHSAVGSAVHNACDSLIWGLLIHTCSQLEILGARLKAIKQKDNQAAKASARYHHLVYRFARMINEEFKSVMLVQFTLSTFVLCFILYVLLSTHDVNIKFLKIMMFGSAMLMQIFFFCWYGNEVKLQSIGISDVIFESDWIQLNDDTKKMLLVIMRRATYPIEFTSAHIVAMNLESFVNLLKTSYSAYNVLQSGQG